MLCNEVFIEDDIAKEENTLGEGVVRMFAEDLLTRAGFDALTGDFMFPVMLPALGLCKLVTGLGKGCDGCLDGWGLPTPAFPGEGILLENFGEFRPGCKNWESCLWDCTDGGRAGAWEINWPWAEPMPTLLEKGEWSWDWTTDLGGATGGIEGPLQIVLCVSVPPRSSSGSSFSKPKMSGKTNSYEQ